MGTFKNSTDLSELISESFPCHEVICCILEHNRKIEKTMCRK